MAQVRKKLHVEEVQGEKVQVHNMYGILKYQKTSPKKTSVDALMQ